MDLLKTLLMMFAVYGTGNTSCSSEFTSDSVDLCAARVGQSQSFCGAANQCTQLGNNISAIVFLIGRNAPKLPEQGLEHWTGVNQLLVYRNALKTGWYDVNPNTPEYTTASDFQWGPTQPQGKEPVTTYRQTLKTYDDYPMVITSAPFPVFCEYGAPLAKTNMGIKFWSTVPVPLTNFVQSNMPFYGCFNEILPKFTPIQCAVA
ncbi:hypothetical protein P879_11742 [Paragonimus westermani]|uniref:C-type lectin domain-containing protein n=1 Tax=Paragonimus westermani TaxID=34504 RepID=A0A8T0DA90_9TREM|nr:hypothetical protein P879_11742 [Paragonimus westermani]